MNNSETILLKALKNLIAMYNSDKLDYNTRPSIVEVMEFQNYCRNSVEDFQSKFDEMNFDFDKLMNETEYLTQEEYDYCFAHDRNTNGFVRTSTSYLGGGRLCYLNQNFKQVSLYF